MNQNKKREKKIINFRCYFVRTNTMEATGIKSLDRRGARLKEVRRDENNKDKSHKLNSLLRSV